uniref:Integrin alpha-2 domain-containing protein n=1 Tax=Electrophorus electricus TaxID=8005 RepID=A0A4W4G4C6_ELEEL
MDLQHTHRSRVSLIMGHGAGLVLVLLAFSALVSGFNLDTTDTLNKEGEKGSFFGFSVALHQQLSPELRSWVLVGAPRARGLGTLRNSHPGALYRCPITAEEYDCERVDIDGDVRLDKESKDNQWLGVTVKSQGIGGKVVTCAHLYELRQRVSLPSETRDPIGRCYMLSEDLTERDDLDGGEWKFCEGRPQGHEQFGFCQQGLAASFTPDNNYILFGAPGTYNWKGLLFMASPIEDALVYKTLEPSSQPMFEDVAQNSYLGFSVDSAKGIMNRGELTFVAGAPRANHTGAVVLLKKDNIYRLVPEHILWGEELASSFGYSVTTADLNQDGWTDLIVGAPNFFDRKAEIGGAVYIFLNPASHWEKARPIRLNGTYDSMFGMTVSSIGDLDQDGYGDVAIGAPFDGAGKVFIFRGSATGINTKPSQVLDGLNAGVSRFGYSISGGLDIDGNLYPDLAVGSLSDQVVIYRSRPVVHVIRDISMEPQDIDLALHNCKGREGMCPHPISKTFSKNTQLFSDAYQDSVSKMFVKVALTFLFFVSLLFHQVNFLREGCGDDKICQSNLKLSYQFGIRAPISVPFTPLPLDEEGVPVFSLSDQKSIMLEVIVTNIPSDPENPQEDGDDAHAAQLFVTLPNTLSYSGFRGQQLKFYIILSTSGITIETTSLSVYLLMSTLAQPHQLFFSGTVKGESAMETLDDVGSEVQYEFTVSNTGQSVQTLGSAFLNIMWPHELANGKWLLYPSSLHIEGQGRGARGVTSTPRTGTIGARQRSSEAVGLGGPEAQLQCSAAGLEAGLEDCLLGSTRCVLFQCPLHSFTGTSIFKVKARLWNSTFIEEFSFVSVLELLVRANITVKSSLKHLVLRDAAVSVMIYPEHGPSDQYSIPWWIILIAFLAGILVLALLVCILWKCGFFQRAHYKDKVPQYHAVKIPRQERSQFQDKKSIILHKKEWVTHWSDAFHDITPSQGARLLTHPIPGQQTPGRRAPTQNTTWQCPVPTQYKASQVPPPR